MQGIFGFRVTRGCAGAAQVPQVFQMQEKQAVFPIKSRESTLFLRFLPIL
jgi:hypothetical protein